MIPPPGNNEAAAFVNVQGPPHVLVIEGTPGEGHNIIAALQATRIQVAVGIANDIPTTLDGLARFAPLCWRMCQQFLSVQRA